MHQIGPYQLVEFIDSGSFANVYKCINRETNEVFACKVVNLTIRQNQKLLENFKNELFIHSRMAHPGIIRLHDLQLDDKYIYIILEYSTYGNLEQVVQLHNGIGEYEAAIYFKQVMDAISYIHKMGVAHRDVTLKNILITADGRAKLSDFGLCKIQQENSYLTTTCGTFVYVPPEILNGQHYDGMKADIWSAGICLYAMTSNHLPWVIDDKLPPEQIWEAAKMQICSGNINFDDKQSELLRDLISQMLAIEPEYRPDCEEILAHPWFAQLGQEEQTTEYCPNQYLIDFVNQLCENLLNVY